LLIRGSAEVGHPRDVAVIALVLSTEIAPEPISVLVVPLVSGSFKPEGDVTDIGVSLQHLDAKKFSYLPGIRADARLTEYARPSIRSYLTCLANALYLPRGLDHSYSVEDIACIDEMRARHRLLDGEKVVIGDAK